MVTTPPIETVCAKLHTAMWTLLEWRIKTLMRTSLLSRRSLFLLSVSSSFCQSLLLLIHPFIVFIILLLFRILHFRSSFLNVRAIIIYIETLIIFCLLKAHNHVKRCLTENNDPGVKSRTIIIIRRFSLSRS